MTTENKPNFFNLVNDVKYMNATLVGGIFENAVIDRIEIELLAHLLLLYRMLLSNPNTKNLVNTFFANFMRVVLDLSLI